MAIVWSDAARRDLAQILDYLVEKDGRFALRVQRRLFARVASLEAVPLQGRVIAGTRLRILSLPDIAYVLSYRPTTGAILIVRLRHTREVRDEHDFLR